MSEIWSYEYYPRDTERGYGVRKLEIPSGNIIHKAKAIVSFCKKISVHRCVSSRRKLRRPKPESGTSPDPDFDRHSAVMRAADTRQALNLALRAGWKRKWSWRYVLEPSPGFCTERCIRTTAAEALNHHYAQKSPEVIRAEFERSAVSFNSRILCFVV